MATGGAGERIAAVRRFNRFYTQKIGVLEEGLLRTPFSLAEARVLYELAHRRRPTASELSHDLGLDPGYLSRILSAFRKRGLLIRERSDEDGRVQHLALTPKGQQAFAPLNRRSREEVRALLRPLSEAEQQRLMAALETIEGLLGAPPAAPPSILLRPHVAGDMGWVVQRHGALYTQEYGWDGQFEALVAEIVAQFLRTFDAKSERCWIAEKDGESVGSVFIVRQSRTIAKLRLMIVEPRARGLGIGKRLVAQAVSFARQTGYRKLMLWTNSVLVAARHIYAEAGFQLVQSEPHHSFGHDLIGETWELRL